MNMHLGFDAKRAFQNHTGLGNYSRYVIDLLSRFYPSNTYFLFAPQKRENPQLKKICARKNVISVFPKGLSRIFSSLWRTFGIKKRFSANNIKIFHGLSNELPAGIKKTSVQAVVTIHDLIFMRYPEYYSYIDRQIYKRKVKDACLHSRHIIAVSECTKTDIVHFFNIPPRKISVIYQGYNVNFNKIVSNRAKNGIIKKYQLPSKFILNVGTIETRKNLLLIVKSLPKIDENIHLVAIGKSTVYQSKVKKQAELLGVSHRLHILNNVPFEELPAFYQLSKIFVYPSLYEGFGIPVVEALASKIPVIAARGSSLEEAGGKGSIYVDPDNASELAEKIMEIFDNEKLSESMIKMGRRHIKRFADKNIAVQLMGIYDSTICSSYPFYRID